MKISELIAELEKSRDAFGDIAVHLEDAESDCDFECKSAKFAYAEHREWVQEGHRIVDGVEVPFRNEGVEEVAPNRIVLS